MSDEMKEQIEGDSESNPIIVKGWMVCPCGERHPLIPAIETPVYWCGNDLLKLKVGDDVEI